MATYPFNKQCTLVKTIATNNNYNDMYYKSIITNRSIVRFGWMTLAWACFPVTWLRLCYSLDWCTQHLPFLQAQHRRNQKIMIWNQWRRQQFTREGMAWCYLKFNNIDNLQLWSRPDLLPLTLVRLHRRVRRLHFPILTFFVHLLLLHLLSQTS